MARKPTHELTGDEALMILRRQAAEARKRGIGYRKKKAAAGDVRVSVFVPRAIQAHIRALIADGVTRHRLTTQLPMETVRIDVLDPAPAAPAPGASAPVDIFVSATAPGIAPAPVSHDLAPAIGSAPVPAAREVSAPIAGAPAASLPRPGDGRVRTAATLDAAPASVGGGPPPAANASPSLTPSQRALTQRMPPAGR